MKAGPAKSATADVAELPPDVAASQADFSRQVIRWQKQHGRHDLPWQRTTDPYRVWLSEIMLQQTQVSTVIPYYERFLNAFPDIEALAGASQEQVMGLWSGLGYYSRGRNLHKAAQQVASLGAFPRKRELIEALPGIGRSTAAAIAVFCFGETEAILDGNVKRVLARHFAVAGFPGEKRVENRLWALAESLLPQRDIRAYTQGLMDLGATLCTTRAPSCDRCPVRSGCKAMADGEVANYPGRRPAKPVPQRQTAMLVLERAGEVLLEKRPSPGIWGGLWSFPEAQVGADIRGHCRDHLGCSVVDPERLEGLVHGFTHFRLEIEPWHCQVSSVSGVVREPAYMWLPISEARGAAIPVPVKKILERLAPGPKARRGR